MKIKNLMKKLLIPAAGLCVAAPAMLGAGEVAFAQTGGYSASDAVAWVKSLEGQGIDYDGAYGNQCVDLIKAYYDFLGVTPVSGNANTYTYNSLPAGWQRIEDATPQPGDILVYTGGSYGHVAIYTGDNESYHQNWGGSYVQSVSGYDFSSMGYWGVIRPDFTDSDDSNTDTSYDDPEYVSYSDESDDYEYEDNYDYYNDYNGYYGYNGYGRYYGYNDENLPPFERDGGYRAEFNNAQRPPRQW